MVKGGVVSIDLSKFSILKCTILRRKGKENISKISIRRKYGRLYRKFYSSTVKYTILSSVIFEDLIS